MNESALDTLPRAAKGAVQAAPVLDGLLRVVADAVQSWAGVEATTHWDLYDSSRVDGIDFYVGEAELGHIHLDGSIHLATNPALGHELVAAGQARPFRYAKGWVEAEVQDIGSAAAIDLFSRNYKVLAGV